jgi:hypothetical protein
MLICLYVYMLYVPAVEADPTEGLTEGDECE